MSDVLIVFASAMRDVLCRVSVRLERSEPARSVIHSTAGFPPSPSRRTSMQMTLWDRELFAFSFVSPLRRFRMLLSKRSTPLPAFRTLWLDRPLTRTRPSRSTTRSGTRFLCRVFCRGGSRSYTSSL